MAALVQIITWRCTGGKPSSEAMMVCFTEAYMRQSASVSQQIETETKWPPFLQTTGSMLSPTVVDIQLLPWLTEYTPLGYFLKSVILLFLIRSSVIVLFHHDNYVYSWNIHIQSHPFSTMDLGFRNFGSAVDELQVCFGSWIIFSYIGLNTSPSDSFIKFVFSIRLFCRAVEGFATYWLVLLWVSGAVD